MSHEYDSEIKYKCLFMTARNHWQAEAIRFRFAADKDTTAILSLVDNPTKGIIARFKIPTKYFKSGLDGLVETFSLQVYTDLNYVWDSE